MSLDSYDVIRELGRGGMAVVHLARQRDLGRLVALKELAGLNVGDPSFTERFLRESRVAGSLNHPNIVAVYEYFNDGGTPFIAMELVEGGSLRPLIGDLSIQKVARVLEDLLAAVGYSSRAGIVHRDLKPENALLSKDGRIKVADFGIAKAAVGGQQGLTSEGMTVGTPEYMSPEQAMARDVGPASDLYAVGCMTYEMLTGRLPFSDVSQTALLLKQVSEPVPDVREVDPLIPESVALWVTRMTAKDPDERPADANAAWQSFEDAVVEFAGPLWRRDADIVPASEIELDDIPPQTATPLRLKRRPSAAPIGGASVTGFQTYQAPAALHEQLKAEGVEGAVVTPPSTPAVATPRSVTPPPQRAAAVAAPVAVQAPPAKREAAPPPPPAEEQAPGLPLVPILGGALVVAIVAFVLGMSGGSSAQVASVTGDGFVLKAPSGWTEATGVTVPGAAKSVALAPPGAGEADGVAAGRVTSVRLASLVGEGGEAERVQLGAGQAARFGGPDTGGSLYVLPTDAGTIAIACTAAPAVRDACENVAGSLELTSGKALDPGPTAEGARAVGGALMRLRDAIGNPSEDLARADSRGAQAFAATDLARAYRAAADEISDAPVGALAMSARDSLSGALKRVGDAWGSYGRAARSGDSGAAASARSAVASARGRVRSARAALAAAGYPEGG